MTDNPVSLVWITPDIERRIVEMARVSADPSKKSRPDADLVRYLIRNQHWSPFESVNICIEVNTSRAIGRQMLRHWTMRPQEFSQRYQSVAVLGDPIISEARYRHPTNRQASVPMDDETDPLNMWWQDAQREVWDSAQAVYEEALEAGIAKELARNVLPEGLTPTRMFFNCPVRSALHFCALRSKEHGSQDEIVTLAEGLWGLMEVHMPVVCEAFSRHLELERARKTLPAKLAGVVKRNSVAWAAHPAGLNALHELRELLEVFVDDDH